MRLYLASTSPARQATLRAAGIEPITLAPGVDEEALVNAVEAEQGPLTPENMVQLLARAKAEAVASALASDIDGLILGGDSAFVIDGNTHGKPLRPETARSRWHAQNGRTGVLWSGHWLIDHSHGRVVAALGRPDAATVTFARLDDAEIDAYVDTGEPLAVAGAFTIDSLGGPFIRRVEGDPSTVVGLSLSTLRELVRELGHAWPTLWNRAGAADAASV